MSDIAIKIAGFPFEVLEDDSRMALLDPYGQSARIVIRPRRSPNIEFVAESTAALRQLSEGEIEAAMMQATAAMPCATSMPALVATLQGLLRFFNPGDIMVALDEALGANDKEFAQ